MTIIRLKNVPMDAVKKVVKVPEGEELDYTDVDDVEFEDIDDLEDTERYEKIKFNDGDMYQIDIAPYLDYVEVVVDDPDTEELEEGFYNFYYRGE